MGNRASRRIAEKLARIQEKEDRWHIQKNIKKELEKARDEIADETSHFYMGMMYTIFVLVLRRQFNFGPVRLQRALNEMAAIVNDIDEGRVTVYDLQRESAEAGIRIVFDNNRNIIGCNVFEERPKPEE